MKKLTKGAISAAAASVLLLGGATSLAYWNDAETTPGTVVNSGHLKLDPQTAGQWRLNGEATAYNPATQRLVPGDTLTKTATFVVDAQGDYLNAEFTATNPAWATGSAAALTNELQLTGAYQVSTDNGATWSAPVTGSAPVANGNLVRAVLTINWPFGTVNNNSNVAAGLNATLDAVTVTVTQVP